jgi:DNA polymerase III, gamma/tau subunits
MPLWVDKHRPKEISQLSHHSDVSSRLSSLASDPRSLPHLLFYGPSGAGKKTRIACLLKAIYGNGAERLRLDKRTFVTSTNRSVDINMICSNYHIEMNPGDAGIYDRYVVQDVIKEMAANKSLNAGGGGGGFSGSAAVVESSTASVDDASKRKKAVEYKIVVLMEVDKLTRQAQAALRRTMEKYSSSCRLILCCNNQSKVIEPVRSRCLGIRVAAPSIDEVSCCCCLLLLFFVVFFCNSITCIMHACPFAFPDSVMCFNLLSYTLST